jgi:primase-polymerase (primpol)-like protein
MEELLKLRELLLKGDMTGALAIVDELEEMSRDDKINNIRSYAVILLMHLIKQKAENRTTKSWELSIRNSIRGIQTKNQRRKAGGTYLNTDELSLAISEAYTEAVDRASSEVEEGRYEPHELAKLVNRQEICDRAMILISTNLEIQTGL